MLDARAVPSTSPSNRRSGYPCTRRGVHDPDEVRRVGLDRHATLHNVGPKARRVLRMVLDD